MQSAKEYFSNYLADDTIRPLNEDLVIEIIKSFKPMKRDNRVFEFGCGQGKNLALLKQLAGTNRIKELDGRDISKKAVTIARKQKGRYYVHHGDENTLRLLSSHYFDVSFTCSVLDHIPDERTVMAILWHLKRMSTRAVILYETLDYRPEDYYYSHDGLYELLGFRRDPPNYSYFSDVAMGGDGSVYRIYKWFRRESGRNNKRDGSIR